MSSDLGNESFVFGGLLYTSFFLQVDPFGTPWLCTADRVRICNHSMLAVFRSGAVCLAVLLAVFASAASIQLTSGSLTVYASKTFDGSDVSSARRSTVPLAGSLEQVLKLENNFYLNARLVIQEDANPKQVFLRLHKPDTNIEAIFAFKKESRAGTFSLQLSTNGKLFRDYISDAGVYQGHIYIAGPEISEPLDWNFGQVLVTDFVKSEKSAPRDQPLPLIHHTFKSPERRPDESFSIVFTFLVSVPFFLFLLLWWFTGLSVKAPATFSSALFGLLFMSTIAAILILLGMYWVGLPIFQTLQGLALLGVIGVLIGNKALGVILDSPSSIKEKKD